MVWTEQKVPGKRPSNLLPVMEKSATDRMMIGIFFHFSVQYYDTAKELTEVFQTANIRRDLSIQIVVHHI